MNSARTYRGRTPTPRAFGRCRNRYNSVLRIRRNFLCVASRKGKFRTCKHVKRKKRIGAEILRQAARIFRIRGFAGRRIARSPTPQTSDRAISATIFPARRDRSVPSYSPSSGNIARFSCVVLRRLIFYLSFRCATYPARITGHLKALRREQPAQSVISPRATEPKTYRRPALFSRANGAERRSPLRSVVASSE